MKQLTWSILGSLATLLSLAACVPSSDTPPELEETAAYGYTTEETPDREAPVIEYQPAYPSEVASEGLAPEDTEAQRALSAARHVEDHEGEHEHAPGEGIHENGERHAPRDH